MWRGRWGCACCRGGLGLLLCWMGSVGLDVFGADAYSDEASGSAAEDGEGCDQAQQQWWLDGGGVAENVCHEVMGDDLEALGDAGGEFAAGLDVGEGELGDEWRAER